MIPPASASSAARLEEIWKRIGAVLEGGAPLPSRIAEAAVIATGARDATLYLRERDTWVRTGEKLVGGVGAGRDSRASARGRLPPGRRRCGCPSAPRARRTAPRVLDALARAAREHAAAPRPPLRIARRGASPDAPGQGRRVRAQGAAAGARVPLRPRPVARRTARSLRARRRGSLSVDLADRRPQGLARPLRRRAHVLLERSVGGELLTPGTSRLGACRREADQQRRLRRPRRPACADGTCEKCLAVPISVPGRRLGVLAVADKESRDGRVLDFTPTDARLLSLFANQAAAAIQTARLHREAIEKERIERELELAAAIQRQILPRDLPSVAGLELAAAIGRRARSAATTSTSSRSPAAGSASSWRTSRARACRPRCSCRRCTRPCTSRSTTRRRSPISSAASTGISSATPRRASS